MPIEQAKPSLYDKKNVPELADGEVYLSTNSTRAVAYHTKVCRVIEKCDKVRIANKNSISRKGGVGECDYCSGVFHAEKIKSTGGSGVYMPQTKIRMHQIQSFLSEVGPSYTTEIVSETGIKRTNVMTALKNLEKEDRITKAAGSSITHYQWEINNDC